MRWCLLVFANSPKWCTITGWVLTQASLLIQVHWRGKKGHIMETYSQISHSIHMGQATQQSDGRCNLGRSGLDCTGCSCGHRLMLEMKYRKILPNVVNTWTSGSTLPYGKVTAPKTSAVGLGFLPSFPQSTGQLHTPGLPAEEVCFLRLVQGACCFVSLFSTAEYSFTWIINLKLNIKY